MKRAYYYFFYKIYEFIKTTSKAMGGSFLTDVKAIIVVGILEIWSLLSLGVYYAISTKTVIELSISMPIIYVPLLVIFGFNYLIFVHSDKWKEYNIEFDQLPKGQNIKGGWVVFGIILFIVINVIFSFYLMSQVDWSQYS